jgi:hypothetical protein
LQPELIKGLSSLEQDCDPGQLQSDKETSGKLVLAGRDSAEVIELIEELQVKNTN